MPTSGGATLRTRLLIEDIDAKFSPPPEEAGAGRVTFTIGGVTYQYDYKEEYGAFRIKGKDFSGKIVYKAYKKNYDLYVDQDMGVTISSGASDMDFFTMPSPINVNLVSLNPSEPEYELPPELKVVIAVALVAVVAGVVAYLGLRKRAPEEAYP